MSARGLESRRSCWAPGRRPGGVLAALLLGGVSSGCMPDSVQALDAWLEGMETGDDAAVVRWSHPADQPLVERGLADRAGADTTSLVALALPPKPLGHELIEIAQKSADGSRHVVLTELTLKNPLPYASERVGQELQGIPKTRSLTTRFLSVRVPEVGWRVKLDLPAVLARARFAERFQAAMDARRWDEAAALLDEVPAPPDDPNALSKSDRLADVLAAELEKARKRTRTSTVTSGADPETPRGASKPAPE